MKNAALPPLQFSPISPATVYISTTPDQSSYANFTITLVNAGSDTVNVKRIAITLPTGLAPAASLNSITPGTSVPDLWSFGPSQITPGEFDATPQSGNPVPSNPNDTWQFTLNMVTLVSTITKSSVNVKAVVTLSDGSSYTTLLDVNIAKAVAGISYFNSQPSTIEPGETSKLSWQCEGIDYCIISPGDKKHRPSSGTLDVRPEETTPYYLLAYAAGVILSVSWPITVEYPQIIRFGDLNGQTNVDYGHQITLSWICNQATDSIKLTDNSGVTVPGTDTHGNTPQKGHIKTGRITAPTIFTLTAHGKNKKNFDQKDAIININNVTAILTASPATGIWEGDEVTLSWDVKNASAVSLSPALANGPSMQNLSGSVSINPTADITYTLSATGFVNNQETTIAPWVSLPVQLVVINSFTVTPSPITPANNGSNQATLAWNTQAEVVSIDNNIGTVNPVSSSPINAPADGTVFTLTAGTNLNPALTSQRVQVANAFGPYALYDFEQVPGSGFGEWAYEFYVDDPNNYLNDLSGLECDINFTGITPIGGFATIQESNYTNGICFTTNSSNVTFYWADPNNQSGTITIVNPGE